MSQSESFSRVMNFYSNPSTRAVFHFNPIEQTDFSYAKLPDMKL